VAWRESTDALGRNTTSAQNCVGSPGEKPWRIDERYEESSGCCDDRDNHDCGHDGLLNGRPDFAHRSDSYRDQDAQANIYCHINSYSNPHSNGYTATDRYADANAYADQHADRVYGYLYARANRYPGTHRYAGATDQYT
jgi:hypothetical protein